MRCRLVMRRASQPALDGSLRLSWFVESRRRLRLRLRDSVFRRAIPGLHCRTTPELLEEGFRAIYLDGSRGLLAGGWGDGVRWERPGRSRSDHRRRGQDRDDLLVGPAAG